MPDKSRATTAQLSTGATLIDLFIVAFKCEEEGWKNEASPTKPARRVAGGQVFFCYENRRRRNERAARAAMMTFLPGVSPLQNFAISHKQLLQLLSLLLTNSQQ